MSPQGEAMLGSVGWAGVKHAYGQADDLPGMLRGLVSGFGWNQESAWDGLFGAALHQGTVYEATGPVVRVLLAMMRGGDAVDATQTLRFIAHAWHGRGYWQVHAAIFAEPHWREFTRERTQQDHTDDLRREQGWVADVKAAIREGADVFRSCLKSEQAAVRACGLTLLGLACPDDAQVRGGVAAHLASESAPLARGAALLALAQMTCGKDATRELLHKSLSSGGLERIAAGVGCLWAQGRVGSEGVARVLRDAKADEQVLVDLEDCGEELVSTILWLEDWDGSVGAKWEEPSP